MNNGYDIIQYSTVCTVRTSSIFHSKKKKERDYYYIILFFAEHVIRTYVQYGTIR